MPETTDLDRTQPARQLPPAPAGGSAVRANGGRASGPDAMRREIEATRARMSRTLDEIEGALVWQKRELVRKKDELVARATLRGVRRRLAREPWRSMAMAFVAGYIVAAIRD